MEKDTRTIIGEAIGTATRYGYYETARKQLAYGLDACNSDETKGRLRRARGIIDVLDALYGKDETHDIQNLYAHAAYCFITADELLQDTNETIQHLTVECMYHSGYIDIGDWYQRLYNISRKPLDLQMAEFPQIRAVLFENKS